MKKAKFLLLPVAAALLFAGCAKTNANKAPSVSGVKDFQCIVYDRVDLLDGVAALDYEDGDITPDMQITVTPEVAVKDGYAMFTRTGEYTVTYKIEDAGGKTAEEQAFVEVTERELYLDFTQPDGFSVTAQNSASLEKSGMVNGEYIIKAHGGEIAEDIKLTREYALVNNVQYTFKYVINSNCTGRIKAMADGGNAAELQVSEGRNELTFAHRVISGNIGDKTNVRIDLCFGGIADDIDWKIISAEAAGDGLAPEQAAIKDFSETHNRGVFNSDCGKLTYTVESFFAQDYEHEIVGPDFFVGGSGGNYVITFKAKATKPVEFVFVSPRAVGWDPTLIWAREYLAEEEKVFTFYCNDGSSDSMHKLVWQFGSANNQKYRNVTIEISDIKISYKNTELDG